MGSITLIQTEILKFQKVFENKLALKKKSIAYFPSQLFNIAAAIFRG